MLARNIRFAQKSHPPMLINQVPLGVTNPSDCSNVTFRYFCWNWLWSKFLFDEKSTARLALTRVGTYLFTLPLSQKCHEFTCRPICDRHYMQVLCNLSARLAVCGWRWFPYWIKQEENERRNCADGWSMYAQQCCCNLALCQSVCVDKACNLVDFANVFVLTFEITVAGFENCSPNLCNMRYF